VKKTRLVKKLRVGINIENLIDENKVDAELDFSS
jgi:hypothetical protein